MQAAPEATEETEAYISALEAEVARLKSNQSFGYVRGRGLMAIPAGKIDTSKPRVEALDVSPEQAPHG